MEADKLSGPFHGNANPHGRRFPYVERRFHAVVICDPLASLDGRIPNAPIQRTFFPNRLGSSRESRPTVASLSHPAISVVSPVKRGPCPLHGYPSPA